MFNYYQWKRAAIASERLADGLPPAPPSRGVTRDGLVPWVPPSATRTGVAPLFPEPLPEPDEETLEHRHTLAASAQARYDMWAATTLGWDDDEDKKAKEAHPSQHTFRDRVPAKELHGRMSFARHASHAARIAEAEAANRRYLKRPQYQDPGLNTIGMTFSFHRQGYHMRQRMKSMEVGGPMRFQAQTESERIMEENVKASARDVFSATVPSEHEHPRAAVAAQREGARARWVGPRDFDSTSMHPRKQLSPPSALLGAGEPYRDTLDQDCYGNLNYGHTRVRDPALEVRSAMRGRATSAGSVRRLRRLSLRPCAAAPAPRAAHAPRAAPARARLRAHRRSAACS